MSRMQLNQAGRLADGMECRKTKPLFPTGWLKTWCFTHVSLVEKHRHDGGSIRGESLIPHVLHSICTHLGNQNRVGGESTISLPASSTNL